MSASLELGGGMAGDALVGTTGTVVVSSGKGFDSEDDPAGFWLLAEGLGASLFGGVCDEAGACAWSDKAVVKQQVKVKTSWKPCFI
jgi:hypothetical protein